MVAVWDKTSRTGFRCLSEIKVEAFNSLAFRDDPSDGVGGWEWDKGVYVYTYRAHIKWCRPLLW